MKKVNGMRKMQKMLAFCYGAEPLSRRQRMFYLQTLRDLGFVNVPSEKELRKIVEALPGPKSQRKVAKTTGDVFHIVSPISIIKQQLGNASVTKRLSIYGRQNGKAVSALCDTPRWNNDFRAPMRNYDDCNYFIGDYVWILTTEKNVCGSFRSRPIHKAPISLAEIFLSLSLMMLSERSSLGELP
ncbi:hypothetical protein BC829DRAFT_416430 [Chytridium lagenaria]|nr:hypothetical protein BC829DRAFT_416430 [Chytridium lagenaria]